MSCLLPNGQPLSSSHPYPTGAARPGHAPLRRYTQRFNQLQGRDGPLFRGRYRAIIIDADAYLMAVSRYIHLNPLEAGIVSQVQAYPWSSYPAYIGLVSTPLWLTTPMTLKMAGSRRPQAVYQAFVEQGLDDELRQFYRGERMGPILGDDAFEDSLAEYREVDREIPASFRRGTMPSLDEIVQVTAEIFGVARASLLVARRGRGQSNPARQVALYLSRDVGGYSLGEIAAYFGLGHDASVSRSAQGVRQQLEVERELAQLIEAIRVRLVEV